MLIAGLLLPGGAAARSASLKESQAQLQAARQQAAAHQKAARAASAQQQAVAAKAAALAASQVAAAAALRALETQTATAAAGLASLQAQSQTAAQALQQNQAALESLLPVMQRLAGQPAATLLAIPLPPADAIRGILVMQGIAAEIELHAAAVRQDSARLGVLMAQTQAQQKSLAQAVITQQQGETALSARIAAAKAVELAAGQTAVSEAAAAAAANRNIQTLSAVISRLQVAAVIPLPPAAIIAPGGAPVAGQLVQKFGAATLAGPAQGVSYRAAPGARVAAPCAGPVLFANTFQSYGLVVILDCGGNNVFVLSGMAALDVAAGQRIARGQPLGQMPPFDAGNPQRLPLLYVELRHDGTPADPGNWLGGGGSG